MALTDSLVSYWKFDESSGNAADSAGSNTGTNNNTVTYTTGKINNCAVFNGSNQNFSIGTSIFANYSALSISAWINLDVLNDYRGITWKSNNLNYSIGMRVTNGNVLQGVIANSSSETYITGGTTLSATTWYHAVLVYDGTDIRIYLDGSSDATPVAKTGNVKNTSDTAYIGSQNNNTFFDGKIDEMGVWSRALTSTEVGQLYNSGDGLAYPLTVETFKPKVMFF